MFKVPPSIAQDLLLIHDLVSEPAPGPSDPNARSGEDAKASQELSEPTDSNCASANSDTDSEEVDVVESLLTGPDATGEGGDVELRSPSPSSSESSDSDADPDSDSVAEKPLGIHGRQTNDDFEDEEDEGGVRQPAGSTLRTKNELLEPSIVIPDIVEIDAQEPLEKVGEIMSVIENVVVVKGLASQIENKASERALDSESLLVFENRKVLGYIHETFGPTHQPLYQVRFPSAASVDKELVTISREVFHVPPRSHFVFPSQLKKVKGSDASNVHDEEVNEDEMEFSDDEAEAVFKQQRKRKREGNRESSVSSSRFSTPTPSQMHDHELNEGSFYGTSPYDEYGPYDMDAVPGPSRPAPLPYDDPYQDEPSAATADNTSVLSREDRLDPPRAPRNFIYENSRGRGRGRGRGRERGRGRGRGREHCGRGGLGGGDRRRSSGDGSFAGTSTERRDRHSSFSRDNGSGSNGPRSLSPTSMAIARATGQFADGSTFAAQQVPLSPSSTSTSAYGYWQQQDAAYGQFGNTSQQTYGVQQMHYDQQQSHIQPHINPRFASLFGINMNFTQGQQYSPYVASNSPVASPYTTHTPNDAWVVNNQPQNAPGGNAQSNPANEYVVQTKSDSEEYHP